MLVLAVSAISCTEKKNVESDPVPLSIQPVITRATDTDFEKGDRIGMTVSRKGKSWADNSMMEYNGSVFSSDLCWYLESGDSCSIYAWYPYTAEGTPSSFTVQADQSASVTSSDFMTAVKHGVYPSFNAVDMRFTHRLCMISVTTANLSGEKIESVTLSNLVPTAKVDVVTQTAVADPEVGPASVKCMKVKDDTLWRAIVVPQKTAIQLSVTLSSGKVLTQNLKGMELVRSTKYAVSAVVYNNNVKIISSAQIQDWLDGGDIPGGEEPEPEEPTYEDFDTYFVYDGVRYNTVNLKDGRRWMADNMRYIPYKTTVCEDIADTLAGMFYPLVLNSGHTGLEVSKSEDAIAAQGYLYRFETACGLKVGSVKDEAAARKLEGTKGICPPGWHIPTVDELMSLVGKCTDHTDNEDAAYYYNGDGSLDLLNADGFNMHAYGIITYNTVTKTQRHQNGTMGWLKGNPDAISSCFVMGSSLRSMTFFDDGRVNQAMFYGFLAFESRGTFNGSNVNMMAAVPLRCIADK